MRAGKTHTTGATGHTMVKAQFEALGWGAINNFEHDLGTDLWLMPLDERRFDLLSIAGVQVKSSPDSTTGSYFGQPEKNADGTTAGWWYYEPDSHHFDYWSAHAAPHILVLHDLNTSHSYWVHVTPDRIQSTGKGSKIFVPSTQLVDGTHNRSLIKVATSNRPAPLWEGSAWNQDQKIQKSQQLRYALITPRLIAPHQNGLPKTMSPEQALASLALLRAEVVEGRCPEVGTGGSEDAWEWSFVTAFSEYLESDDPAIFENIRREANESHQIAAATCVWAASLVEHGKSQSALDVIDETLRLDGAQPQDHAWLQVQRSRCLLELGEKDEAKSAAINAYLARSSAPEDPTLTGLAGVAALVLFKLAPFGKDAVRDAIANSDTLAGWWRNQVLTSGLLAHFESDFTDWSRDPSMTIHTKDEAWCHLRATALLSSLVGDQMAWRHSNGRLAKLELMRSDERSSASHVADSLSRLRRSGDHKAVRNSTRRIVLDGPAVAAQLASVMIDLEQSTRTTLIADMTMLEVAADVLSPDVAAVTSNWCLRALGDIQAFQERYDQPVVAPARILDLLAAVVHVLDESQVESILAQMVAVPPQPDQLTAMGYAKVFKAIVVTSWTAEQVATLGHRSTGDHRVLKDEFDRILAANLPMSRNELIPRIHDGDIAALRAFGDVRELAEDSIAGMRRHLAIRVRGLLVEAGAYTSTTEDPLYVMVLLNRWHPLHADWLPVLEVLEAPDIHPNYLVGALEVLSQCQDPKLPNSARVETALRRIMESETDETNVLMQMTSPRDIRGLAAEALESISPEYLTPEDLWTLMRGPAAMQVSVVRILVKRSQPEHFGVLVALSGAEAQEVKVAVALGLADWITRDVLAAQALGLLEPMLQDPGTRLAISVARLTSGHHGAKSSKAILDALNDHPSARVRSFIGAKASVELLE